MGIANKSDEVILVIGGTSSIGLLAIQMAKATGLVVVATTRNPEREQFLKGKGADFVPMDYIPSTLNLTT